MGPLAFRVCKDVVGLEASGVRYLEGFGLKGLQGFRAFTGFREVCGGSLRDPAARFRKVPSHCPSQNPGRPFAELPLYSFPQNGEGRRENFRPQQTD